MIELQHSLLWLGNVAYNDIHSSIYCCAIEVGLKYGNISTQSAKIV